MRFCDKCGSYMKETKEGFVCRKCGNVVQADGRRQSKSVDTKEPFGLVHVVDEPEYDFLKVNQACPKCGNTQAFKWFSRISGEHAGVKGERTIEYFKCTKCSHSWSKVC